MYIVNLLVSHNFLVKYSLSVSLSIFISHCIYVLLLYHCIAPFVYLIYLANKHHIKLSEN